MLTHLECTRCGEHYPADRPQSVCPKDAGILYARYDLAAIKRSFSSARLAGRAPTMWRYDAVLPDADPVSLGEGFTPMLPSREYANVYIKDEGLNPTGSFKARGLSACVTMARHFGPKFGLKKLAIPSAGNAASALAAYAAAAGLEAHIFMPKDVPLANRVECDYYGAHVTLVDGNISDCARKVAELKASEAWNKDGWFDVSTTKEPYRVEGKKTMGYEVAEQLGWKLPQGIIYPTGGGVGLLGMWKAFEEMEALGWIGPDRPKMITVQSSGCAPIVKAWEEGKQTSEMWPNAATIAAGLRVPKPYGDYLILDILKEKSRHRHQRHRRRDPPSHQTLGKNRRHLRRPRRRSQPGRLQQTPRHRIFQARRHSSPVQHRQRPEIFGCPRHKCGAGALAHAASKTQASPPPNRRHHRPLLNRHIRNLFHFPSGRTHGGSLLGLRINADQRHSAHSFAADGNHVAASPQVRPALLREGFWARRGCPGWHGPDRTS